METITPLAERLAIRINTNFSKLEGEHWSRGYYAWIGHIAGSTSHYEYRKPYLGNRRLATVRPKIASI